MRAFFTVSLVGFVSAACSLVVQQPRQFVIGVPDAVERCVSLPMGEDEAPLEGTASHAVESGKMAAQSLESPMAFGGAAAVDRVQPHRAPQPPLAFSPKHEHRLVWGDVLARGLFSQPEVVFIKDKDDQALNIAAVANDRASLILIGDAGKVIGTVASRNLANRTIQSFVPVLVSDRRHWLVAHSRLRLDGAQDLAIELFTEVGESVWRFTPDLLDHTYASAVVSAGDLSGDGQHEIVVGVTAVRRDPRSPVLEPIRKPV